MKTIVTLLAALFLLAGCNTVKGMGQDLRKASEEIDHALNK